jgi:hypothetical protein
MLVDWSLVPEGYDWVQFGGPAGGDVGRGSVGAPERRDESRRCRHECLRHGWLFAYFEDGEGVWEHGAAAFACGGWAEVGGD